VLLRMTSGADQRGLVTCMGSTHKRPGWRARQHKAQEELSQAKVLLTAPESWALINKRPMHSCFNCSKAAQTTA
jgi:hypothetical protein